MADGGWSNAQELSILKWYFGGVVISPPTIFYIGLTTDPPTDDGVFTEVAYTGSSGNYARQSMLPTDWDEANAVAGDPSYIANEFDVTFPTSNQAAGTVTHFVVMDHPTLSAPTNMLFSGTILQPPGGLAINDGTQPQFDNGALRAQLGSAAL